MIQRTKSGLKIISNKFKDSNNYITFKTKIKKIFNSINLDRKYLLPNWMGCLDEKNMQMLFNNINNFEQLNMMGGVKMLISSL